MKYGAEKSKNKHTNRKRREKTREKRGSVEERGMKLLMMGNKN